MPAKAIPMEVLDAPPAPVETTLLELVQIICDETSDDREVVETVRYLLRSGQVRLCGNFRRAAPSAFS